MTWVTTNCARILPRTKGKSDLTARASSFDIIRGILDGSENGMPRKNQNPKLEIRRDVERPYYFVRVTVPVITEDGRKLKRERQNLGFVDEITVKQAKQERAKLLEIVNQGRMLVQSQIRCKDIAKRFLEVRVPQLGFATQNKYRTQIENHILPAFGELRMCDIDRPTVKAWLNAKAEAGLGWWSRIDLKGILSAIFLQRRIGSSGAAITRPKANGSQEAPGA